MLSQAKQEKIEAVFKEYEGNDRPGCAVGVVQEGELVYSRGFGLAGLETGTPITADTVFHLASVSKQFTAAAIALLEETGALSLADPVRKYISFLPEYGHELNVGHLVYMTNGLDDLYDISSLIMGIPEGEYFSKEEAIHILRAADWLKFSPGEGWAYSNSGYFLLPCIIEQVTGQPFDAYVRQQIFEPLGMMDTFVRTDQTKSTPRQASGYARFPLPDEAGGVEYVRQPEMIEFGGAGQAWSSVNDLAKWERNFYDNQLGRDKAFLTEKMSLPGRLNDGTPTRYAYGQFLGERHGLKVIYHEGGAAGTNTVLYRVPEKRLSVICLANTSDFLNTMLRKLGEECYERVADIVCGWEKNITAKAQREEENARETTLIRGMNGAVGMYEDPDSSHIWEVKIEGNRLNVLENYASQFDLTDEAVSEAGMLFRSMDGALEGQFVHLNEGVYEGIEVQQEAAVRVFKRFLPLPLPVDCLREYEGVYICKALETGYRVTAEAGGVRLENLHSERTLLNVVFSPTIRDMFLARYPPLIGWYVVQFRRDEAGRVTAFCFRDEVPERRKWVFERRNE
jgi:CubicO group peptidase (beta-lactamase class C family)